MIFRTKIKYNNYLQTHLQTYKHWLIKNSKLKDRFGYYLAEAFA
jgi:hypothetical protein